MGSRGPSGWVWLSLAGEQGIDSHLRWFIRNSRDQVHSGRHTGLLLTIRAHLYPSIPCHMHKASQDNRGLRSPWALQRCVTVSHQLLASTSRMLSNHKVVTRKSEVMLSLRDLQLHRLPKVRLSKALEPSPKKPPEKDTKRQPRPQNLESFMKGIKKLNNTRSTTPDASLKGTKAHDKSRVSKSG